MCNLRLVSSDTRLNLYFKSELCCGSKLRTDLADCYRLALPRRAEVLGTSSYYFNFYELYDLTD